VINDPFNKDDKVEEKSLIPAPCSKETVLDVSSTVASMAPWIGGPVSSVLAGMSLNLKLEKVN
jgi:hypothetical protein